ncbi:hypothetical protein HBI76_173810 [Parastagonospora nodorum]|nr:hypothetical protein HBI76_173810 [Parastagonospora nodorum]
MLSVSCVRARTVAATFSGYPCRRMMGPYMCQAHFVAQLATHPESIQLRVIISNMKLFLFFLMLAALAAACPPLFNDFAFQGNGTHTTQDLVRDLFDSHPQTGWSEIVTLTGQEALSTWPAGRIMYCFSTPDARKRYEGDIQQAWNLWSNLLGPAGKESGHKLQFFEYIWKADDWQYCYLERKKPDDPWIPNPKVPYGIAWIQEDVERIPGKGPAAVVGYVNENWPRGGKPGRMGMTLNKDQRIDYGTDEAWIAALAHELGHIFGLWHENQRPDRNHYMLFRCNALPGYDEAKLKVEADKRWSMEQVCNDASIAAYYGFYAINDHDTSDHIDPGSVNVGSPWYWRQNYPDRDYDEDSIMHLDSHVVRWEHDEVMFSRLAAWVNRGPDFVPPNPYTDVDLDLQYTNFAPSEKDIEGVKKLYDWSHPN